MKKALFCVFLVCLILGMVGCSRSIQEDATAETPYADQQESKKDELIADQSAVNDGSEQNVPPEPTGSADSREKIMQLQVIAPIKKEPVALSAEDQETVLNTLENGDWIENVFIDHGALHFLYDGATYYYIMGGGIYTPDGRHMNIDLFEYQAFEEMLSKYIEEPAQPFQVPDLPEEQMYVAFNQNDAEEHLLSAEDKTAVIGLLNSCEWGEDAYELDTNLYLVIGETKYFYDTQGIAFVGGTSYFHVNLDPKTAQQINNILNDYLNKTNE